ncbi:hypothetical protein WMY93_032934 [Mugilogobius chulae]|uniref:PDEase domain-containing protein n=1 Tax=Mugilogobius chulae TaxID=88201 RepID=A0AAW0MU94_9GOBI
MATKIIYFVVNGREETAEFGRIVPTQRSKLDLKHPEAFHSDGRLLKISASLQENRKSAPYTLDSCVAVPTQLGSMETRLEQLENRVMEMSQSPDLLQDLDREVEDFKRKLQTVEHLSWMGLFKDNTEKFIHKTGPRLMSVHGLCERGTGPHGRARPLASVHEERQRVRTTFFNMRSTEHLKTPMFDNCPVFALLWAVEEPEMLVLLQTMFLDLDFVSEFQMETRTLQNFLLEVYGHYNNIPFHNFQHCFCVTQMVKHTRETVRVIWLTDLRSKLSRTELLVMLTSALCHDLTIRYNNVYQPDCNILKNVTSEQYKRFELNDQLMKIMVKVSDISNEARPMSVAEPWLDCLLQEFLTRATRRSCEVYRDSVHGQRESSKPSSQTNFIRFVLLPLFTELTKLFPCLQQHILEPVQRALDITANWRKTLQNQRTQLRTRLKKTPQIDLV